MPIFRKDAVAPQDPQSGYPGAYNLGRGFLSYVPLSDAGGLTQFGAALETLYPGKQSSQMHWHEREDEFLFMLEGHVTVIENEVETEIGPGDACAWKAGNETAHCLRNDRDVPARYLIVGTRTDDDICDYPGLDLKATPEGFTHLDDTPWTTN